MSRHGYLEDDGHSEYPLALWRRAVTSAINGKRGQAFLRELVAALDALPDKVLIAEALAEDGAYCAIGSVGAGRGMDMSQLDPEYPEGIAQAFGIAPALVREIEWMNDDQPCSPAERWKLVRDWAVRNTREAQRQSAAGGGKHDAHPNPQPPARRRAARWAGAYHTLAQ